MVRVVVTLLLTLAAIEAAMCVMGLSKTSDALRDEPFWLCLFLWVSAGIGAVVAVSYEWLSDPRRRMKPEELREWALAASQASADGRSWPRWTLWQLIYTTYWGVWFQLGFVLLLNTAAFHSAAGLLSARTLLAPVWR